MMKHSHLQPAGPYTIKRCNILRITLVSLFLLAILRFLGLQTFSASRLSEAAAYQWISFSTIERPRGDILDCNGKPLTYSGKRAFVLIQPQLLMTENIGAADLPIKATICERFGLSMEEPIINKHDQVKPFVIETDYWTAAAFVADNPGDILQKGVSVFYIDKRYDDTSLAKHLTGYLNDSDGNGASGIEKYYDEELSTGMVFGVAGFADARHNLLSGFGYNIVSMPASGRISIGGHIEGIDASGISITSIPADSGYIAAKTAAGEVIDSLAPYIPDTGKASMHRYGIRLTINAEIQQIVESVMESFEIKGAVVVLDIMDGSVIAIASKPDFDPRRVEDYLDSGDKELFNRAVASYNLGSVFKIVDAAALLELQDSTGFNIHDEFFCTGSVKVGGNVFKCSAYREGHGAVDLLRAFAVSCNSYFINAAMGTGYQNLVRMAADFGLGAETGLKSQGIEESPGLLPSSAAYHSYGDIANIAIGQGRIMASPLQVANIAAIIANGGIRNNLNVVDSLVDDEGNKIRNLRVESWKRVISPNTANQVGKLMRAVMTEGTGMGYDIAGYCGACGKTGTAETGQYEDDTSVVHAWFAGYFPFRKPQYSVAVFVENGRNGRTAAAPIFEAIANEVMERGL